MTIIEAARRMKISPPALYAVLNGTAAVTAEMALRFACLTGGAPELYLNMRKPVTISNWQSSAFKRLGCEQRRLRSNFVATHFDELSSR